MKKNGSSTPSHDPQWQLKVRLEQLSGSVDDLEEILVGDEPLDSLEDALARIRFSIIEIEEML